MTRLVAFSGHENRKLRLTFKLVNRYQKYLFTYGDGDNIAQKDRRYYHECKDNHFPEKEDYRLLPYVSRKMNSTNTSLCYRYLSTESVSTQQKEKNYRDSDKKLISTNFGHNRTNSGGLENKQQTGSMESNYNGLESENINGNDSSTKTYDVLQFMLNMARPELHLILGAAATLGITSTVTLILPYASGQVIDLAILTNAGSQIPDNSFQLSKLSLGLFGLTAIAGTGVFIRSILLTKAGNRVVARMRKNLFSSILAQEMAFFDATPTGDLISRLSVDSNLIQKAVTTDAVGALRAVVMSLGSSALLFYSSPELAVVSLCSLPPVFVAARYYGNRLREQQTNVQARLAEATGIAEEIFQGMMTVRQFSAEKHEIGRYSKILTNAHEKAIEAGKVQAIFDGVVHVAANGAILGVLAYGGSMVSSGDMTGGDLAGFLMYSLLMAGNISSLSSTYAEMLRAVAASERILRIIHRNPTIPPNFSPNEVNTKNFLDSDVLVNTDLSPLAIEFDNVDFTYPSRKNVPILSKLSFMIYPGEKVALCGGSGSGKSTIASLLTRLYESPTPNRNESIKIGGKDIRTLCPKELRESIGVVSQEPLLFAESIADNIRYGRRTATDKEVEKAARIAHVLKFTETLPDGLRTQVGQRGTLLSGGQKQRIAIARVILKDPPIVIFDEATSALDAESERHVQKAVGNVMKGRTVLSVAHRLSTIMQADRIMVLKDGKISEEGKFKDLIKKKDGAFIDLMGSQINTT